MEGASVMILDDDDASVSEGTLGEIAVTGPMVSCGYVSGADPTGTTRFGGSVLRTGDAGFMLDGELFVLGRLGDSIKVAGRHVYAESLEIRLAATLRISQHRCVVIASPGAATDELAIIIEGASQDAVDGVRAAIRPEVGTAVRATFYGAQPGTIIRTTSGKPQRREMWRQLASGTLAAEPLVRLSQRGAVAKRAPRESSTKPVESR
jgi:acyl-CoA synthetase (AMP-forming)/AMP-acid ligase II